jgi:hypothetical protein
MDVVLQIVVGCVGATVLLGLIATISWYIETSVYEPLTNNESLRHERTEEAIKMYWWTWLGLLYTIPILFVNAAYDTLSGILGNLSRIFFLLLFGAGALGILQYHDLMFHTFIIVRQCVIVPFFYYFVFPLFNIARMVYNAVIILIDFGVDMYAFYEWGPILIFIKCTIHTTEASNLFGYFGNIFLVFSVDLNAWFQAGFMDHDLDITNTLDAIGIFITTLVAPFTCLCKTLTFFYVALVTWARLPSLHAAINCLLNFFVTLLQIPLITVMSPPPWKPRFDEPTIRACCAVKSLADAIEDTFFIIVQTGWGIFSNSNLPEPLLLFFSTHWAHTVAEPVCAAFILGNMTLTLGVNYNNLNAATGIAYFQFGIVFDQFKAAAGYFASIFCLWNNDAQAVVQYGLLVIINALAFVFEYIGGNIYYFLFGGPLPLYPTAPYTSFANFLAFYFPNYWLLPTFDNSPSTYVYHTALDATFQSLFITSQAIGNLFANLLNMDPLGGIIQHLLNLIICLIQIVLNIASFFFPIITFNSDPRTTMRQVNFDNFFNELYFLSGSAGDFLRQFAEKDPLTNATCQISPDEKQNSVYCCGGDLIENIGDAITVMLQQLIHFLQDLLTIPTGNVVFCLAFAGINASNQTMCLRIPDLSVALFLVDEALCDFTCVVTSVIPMINAFQCSFPLPGPPPDPHTPPQPVKPCGHVSTCVGLLMCSILRIILVPFYVYNSFFVQTIQGVSFNDFTTLGGMALQIFFNVIADALGSFGLLINCTLCAFSNPGVGGTNCNDDIYQLFLTIGTLVRFLPLILTRTFTLVVKLVLTVLVGLFTGNPIKAAVDFIVGILTDLFGGLASAAVDFLAQLFDAIGLGFIGDFIKLLYKGFCPLLQVILNAIIIILDVLTFGMAGIKFVNLCCTGDPKCSPGRRKRSREENNVIDGVLQIDLENWISGVTSVISWEEDNPCNQTVTAYSDSPWGNLTDSQQDEVMYCLVTKIWLYRNDSQQAIRNSTCDVMVIEYNGTNWSTIGLLERLTLIDCVWSRLYTEGIRMTTGLWWIPVDIMTNDYRKYVFGMEFGRGLFIYWQYFSDTTVTSDVFLSAAYQASWQAMGLNTTFYASVQDVDGLLRFRDQYRLVDYFAWNNNATQYQAVKDVSIGVWNFANLVMQKIFNTSVAKSDSNTDPTQYLQYSYSMDSASAGISSSVYGLFSDLIYGFMNMSAFWSNPDNVKKRSGATKLLREGTWGMYQAAKNQALMMATDWRLSKLNESKFWSGNCSVEDGAVFAEEYNTWLHQDERSLVYHLSRWYGKNKDKLFKTYPISHPREGDRRIKYNQSQHLFSYKNSEGKMVGESGIERVWRFYDTFTQGSTASNKRWQSVSRIFETFKERVYINILRNNAEAAVEYINTIYKVGTKKRDPSVAAYREDNKKTPTEYNNDLLDRFYRQKEGIKYVSRVKVINQVDIDRKAQQDKYCPLPEYKGDGLCNEWVPPPTPPAIRDPAWDTPIITNGKGAKYRVSSSEHLPILNNKHAHGTILTKDSLWNSMRRKQFVTNAIIMIDGLIDLTCYTNITFGNSTLCEECFIIDQALGRIETGLGWVLEFYTGGQFANMLQVSLDFFNYAFDDNAPVVVGDGSGLDVHHFPGYDGTWYYNLRYFGDNTPNKTRISDVIALVNNVTNATNSTQDFNVTTNYYYLNGWIAYVIISIFGVVWNFINTVLSFASGAGQGGSTDDIFSFFVDWFFLCDWLTGEDFRGTVKRFSIGETILIFGFGWLGITVLFVAVIGFNPFSFIVYSGTTFMFVVSFFLSIQINFSFLCFPGLPATLADDVLYFLFYTVLPKCAWMYAFLIDDITYDNETCFFCNTAQSWHILNCAADRGFGDIFSNIIFMLEFYAPSAIQWIRDSRIIPIILLYQIPYVNERLNAFTNVDMSDKRVYAQYMGCNYMLTLWLNFFLALAFLYLVSFGFPVIEAGFTFFVAVLYLLLLFYVMLSRIGRDLFISRESAPFINAGLVDTPISEQVLDRESGGAPNSDRDYDRLLKTYSSPLSSYTNKMRRRTERMAYNTKEKSVVTLGTLKRMVYLVWYSVIGGGDDDRKQR